MKLKTSIFSILKKMFLLNNEVNAGFRSQSY